MKKVIFTSIIIVIILLIVLPSVLITVYINKKNAEIKTTKMLYLFDPNATHKTPIHQPSYWRFTNKSFCNFVDDYIIGVKYKSSSDFSSINRGIFGEINNINDNIENKSIEYINNSINAPFASLKSQIDGGIKSIFHNLRKKTINKSYVVPTFVTNIFDIPYKIFSYKNDFENIGPFLQYVYTFLSSDFLAIIQKLNFFHKTGNDVDKNINDYGVGSQINFNLTNLLNTLETKYQQYVGYYLNLEVKPELVKSGFVNKNIDLDLTPEESTELGSNLAVIGNYYDSFGFWNILNVIRYSSFDIFLLAECFNQIFCTIVAAYGVHFCNEVKENFNENKEVDGFKIATVINYKNICDQIINYLKYQLPASQYYKTLNYNKSEIIEIANFNKFN